jgi:perosamine synthetase
MPTISNTIYLDAPSVGTAEKRYLSKAIDTGYVSSVGHFIPDFEKKFARYVGAIGAVSTQSGTAALHMALYQLGIKKGDEVMSARNRSLRISTKRRGTSIQMRSRLW